MLGFGTNAALDELDELSSMAGERVVDAPIQRQPNPPVVPAQAPVQKAATGAGAKAFNKEVTRLVPDISSKDKMSLYRKLTKTPDDEPIDDALAMVLAEKLSACSSIEDLYKDV
jgi:hypothetical protein